MPRTADVAADYEQHNAFLVTSQTSSCCAASTKTCRHSNLSLHKASTRSYTRISTLFLYNGHQSSFIRQIPLQIYVYTETNTVISANAVLPVSLRSRAAEFAGRAAWRSSLMLCCCSHLSHILCYSNWIHIAEIKTIAAFQGSSESDALTAERYNDFTRCSVFMSPS